MKEQSSTLQVNISDLSEYVSKTDDKPAHPVTNWMALSSQLQVDGLKSLHDALTADTNLDLEEVKEKYAPALLRDLEMFSKRLEANNNYYSTPPFKQEFYEEVNKRPKEQSNEYKEFLNACSKKSPETHVIEAISAKALIDLSNKPLKETTENLQSNLQHYKEEYAKQTTKDLSTRTFIGLKDKNNIVRQLTFEELQDKKNDIGLNGEQRDFILTCWQQGSFESGWFAGMQVQDKNYLKSNTPNRTQLFIDTSQGSVTLYNRITSQLIDQRDEDLRAFDYVECIETVDITDMKGDSFTPGCSSTKPKIAIQLTNLSKVPFDLPETLKVETTKKELEMSNKVKALDIKANINAIVNGSLKSNESTKYLNILVGETKTEELIQNTQKALFSKMSSLPSSEKEEMINTQMNKDPKLALDSSNPEDHKRAVELYLEAQQDQEMQKAFAIKRLDGYLKTQKSSELNAEIIDNLTKGVIAILTPLCNTKEELEAVQENSEKLVKECAKDVAKEMKWSEAWLNFKDKVKDVFSFLTTKPNPIEKIADLNKIKEVIKTNLKETIIDPNFKPTKPQININRFK